MPPYVSVALTDGLGNRLFQIAAILGYAERYGHIPVIVEEWNHRNKHSSTDYIATLFPSLPRIRILDTGPWTDIRMYADEAFVWRELPFHNGNVTLHGYFQNIRYLPAEPIFPRILFEIPCIDVHSYTFLHVRRGDYLAFAEHNVPLEGYWKRCLDTVRGKLYIVSNDMAWCKQHFVGDRFEFAAEDLGILETLACMARCRRGGICANSSFSWWGAYFNTVLFGEAEGRRLYFPDRWVNPPLSHADGIYPPWGSKVAVAEYT